MDPGTRRQNATAIRFPPELHERLTKEAEARDVSINRIVARACELYLTLLECEHGVLLP